MSSEPPATPASAISSQLAETLASRFGDRFVRSDAVRGQHGTSESYHGQILPDGVVFPESTDEVAFIVRACSTSGVPVVAYGAGTSLEGNFAAVRGGVCISFARMTSVLRVGVGDLDCTVQAGVTREDLNLHLRDHGLFFPIDPGANATIGGMTSTRASGTNAVRYGTMRENVISLRVVLPDGREIVTASRSRKSSAGYDLTRLFVGAEGTLGIITEITLRLYGIPETISAAVCAFDTLEGAVQTVVEMIQTGVPIARAELLDDRQIEAVNRWASTSYAVKDTLFLEFHGSPAHVQEQVETAKALALANGGGDFAWASTVEDRNRLWKGRHQAYYAAIGLRAGAKGWTTDVCVPISRLTECILETKEDLLDCPFPATILGHVGDGNFHVIFVIDPENGAELARAKAYNERLVARALAMEGTCTGEHGIGVGKIHSLELELGDAVDLMRTIKRAIDPRDLMNPGKIVRLQSSTVPDGDGKRVGT